MPPHDGLHKVPVSAAGLAIIQNMTHASEERLQRVSIPDFSLEIHKQKEQAKFTQKQTSLKHSVLTNCTSLVTNIQTIFSRLFSTATYNSLQQFLLLNPTNES
jgi:hypothetical protein